MSYPQRFPLTHGTTSGLVVGKPFRSRIRVVQVFLGSQGMSGRSCPLLDSSPHRAVARSRAAGCAEAAARPRGGTRVTSVKRSAAWKPPTARRSFERTLHRYGTSRQPSHFTWLPRRPAAVAHASKSQGPRRQRPRTHLKAFGGRTLTQLGGPNAPASPCLFRESGDVSL